MYRVLSYDVRVIDFRGVGFVLGSTDKGAVDLYAILQQARSEETTNTIASPGEQHATRFDDGEIQFPTTTQRPVPTVTAATTTTTTTTTTPAPTTTTTTTAAPTRQFHGPVAGPVRGRYRGNGANRHTSSTAAVPTTSTVESSATQDEVTERRKFKPNRERNTQVIPGRFFAISRRSIPRSPVLNT